MLVVLAHSFEHRVGILLCSATFYRVLQVNRLAQGNWGFRNLSFKLCLVFLVHYLIGVGDCDLRWLVIKNKELNMRFLHRLVYILLF